MTQNKTRGIRKNPSVDGIRGPIAIQLPKEGKMAKDVMDRHSIWLHFKALDKRNIDAIYKVNII